MARDDMLLAANGSAAKEMNRMIKQNIYAANARKIGTTTLCAAALLLGTLPAFAYSGEDLAKEATVTMAQAKTIALRARPGELTDEELEKEAGGSGLRYSFDIKSRAAIYEVGVDAMTGAVLENAAEGSNPD
jgi:uncharacterized membrane protein YkoI